MTRACSASRRIENESAIATAFGRVHDVANFAILDPVRRYADGLRPFVDLLTDHTMGLQKLGSTAGRDNTETAFQHVPGHRQHRTLSGSRTEMNALPGCGSLDIGRFLGTRECSFKAATRPSPHGGTHFRAEDRIHVLELGKREYGFFDRITIRDDFAGRALFGQRHPGHATR